VKAAHKCVPLALLWILGAAVSSGDLAADLDPDQIYQNTCKQLQSGDLKAAGAGANRLRDLITRHPAWDPDGVYKLELLPSVEAQILRLEKTAQELGNFTDRALKNTPPPEISVGQDPVRAYGDWATSTIDRLRHERDRLIAAMLPASADQAILAKTESYARSQHLLETDILRRMNEAVEKEVEILMPEDRRWQTMHGRLDQIKKGMMESVLDRDRLQRQLEDLQTRTKAYEGALIGLVLEASGSTSGVEAPRAGDPGSLFSSRLYRELEALRSESSQTRAEYLTRQGSLEQYRRFNRVLTAAGLLDDQSEQIRALEKVVEAIPVDGRRLALASPSDWFNGSLLGLLVAAVISLAWVLMRRLQPPTWARTGPSASDRTAGIPQCKDDTDVA